jgi:predicted regulator of Ras-like GTPase activity (Roadblock/LC7/MglB family)
MDAAAAIDELKGLSTQIEAILVAGRDGAVTAATVAGPRAERMGELARDLVGGADSVRGDLGRDALAQLQAATPDGSVFVVLDGDRMAVATTGADPTVGLVFYDLKTLLRQLAAADAKDGGDAGTAPAAATPAEEPVPPEPPAEEGGDA